MFVFCLIITQKPLDRLASNFDWGTRETHGNVLTIFKNILMVDFNSENLVSLKNHLSAGKRKE